MAKVILTKSSLAALRPCNLSRRLALFSDKSSLTVRQAISLGVSVNDILWVAGALGFKDQIVEFANGCAERAATYARYARHAAISAATYARYAASSAASYARYAARYAAIYAASSDSYVEIAAQKADLIRLFG